MDLSSLPRRARISLGPAVDPDTGEYLPARLWESKLGGAPYRLRGSGWPHLPGPDGTAGPPLGFLAQLNLADLEAWRVRTGQPVPLDGKLPTAGLLQFFVPQIEGWGGFDGGRCFVAWWPEVNEDPGALDEPVLAVPDTDGVRFVPEFARARRHDHRRPDGRLPSLISTSDAWSWTPLTQPELPIRLDPVVTEPVVQAPNPWNDNSLPADLRVEVAALDQEDTDTIEAQFGTGGIQVGGYPYFTQDDPRPADTDLVLLWQLDGDNASVCIGDSGVMSFFIRADELAARDFSRVWMSWDCC